MMGGVGFRVEEVVPTSKCGVAKLLALPSTPSTPSKPSSLTPSSLTLSYLRNPLLSYM